MKKVKKNKSVFVDDVFINFNDFNDISLDEFTWLISKTISDIKNITEKESDEDLEVKVYLHRDVGIRFIVWK